MAAQDLGGLRGACGAGPGEPGAVRRVHALLRDRRGRRGPRAPVLHRAAAGGAGRRDQVSYYQPRHDRARRTLRGIDEQVAKAEQAVAGKVPVKRNRFIQLSGGTRSVNRELEEKARALAGLKGYVTNLRACPDGTPVSAEFVIGAYHQLFQVETSKPQCCHICGSSDSSRAPSSSELMPAC